MNAQSNSDAEQKKQTLVHFSSTEVDLKSRILKFEDLVELKIAQVMLKTPNKLLPELIQSMFLEKEEDIIWVRVSTNVYM